MTMTTAWILVVLLAILIIVRLTRSAKLLWVLLITAFTGLVIGMMSGESVAKIKKSKTTDVTTLAKPEAGASCIQFLASTIVNVEDVKVSQSGTVGYEIACDKLTDGYSKSYLSRGRDQPLIVDDS